MPPAASPGPLPPAPWQTATQAACRAAFRRLTAPAAEALPLPLANAPQPTLATLMQAVAEPGFLDLYNAHIAARLRSREGALAFFAMKLAYMLERGAEVALRIRWDRDGQPVAHYADRYRVVDVRRGAAGCVAACCQPLGAPRTRTRHDVLICFRGTAVRLQPTGIRANFDADGIGAGAFAELRHELVGWCRRAYNGGHSITLLGHSQGGAHAMRLLGALPAALQRRCRVIVFNSPRTTHAVAARIVPHLGNVLAVNVRADLVPRAGEVWPAGATIIHPRLPLWATLRAHSRPAFAECEFDGQQLAYDVFVPSWTDALIPVEASRRFVSPWAARITGP